MHIPVLLNEIIGFFKDITEGVIVDGTVGQGGHARAILEACGEKVRLIAIDRDEDMLEMAKKNLSDYGKRVMFCNDSYHKLHDIINQLDIKSVHGILLDLGVSSCHFENQSRGFSFRFNSPLDMRFDHKNGSTALEILKRISEKDLKENLANLGDIRESGKIARAIKTQIQKNQLKTTTDLVNLVSSIGNSGEKNYKKIHPATKLFMCLRMLTNDELGRLKTLLDNFSNCLAKNGLCTIISYHSGEDRLTKIKFRELSKQGFQLMTKKAIRPGDDEIRQNNKARSAKLRIIKKIS